MRTALCPELFSDHCEVVEMPLHNQWVYLIQKNGNSSLRLQKSRDNLVVFIDKQISVLDYVDVYIRNPRARYVSGVNTYLQHLQRDHPELDANTSLWFAKRYKFLNTHYLPQFYWLANLSRYLHSDAKIRIRNFGDFDKITDIKSQAGISAPSREFVDQLLDDHNLEIWLYLDQILLDLTGEQLTWAELLVYYQKNHKNILEHALP